MLRSFKINAVAVSILSALFYLFFEVSKHNPVLAAANAFGEDPYDAIGSFGIQAAAILALLSCVRAFRPSFSVAVSESSKALLARAQMMVVLAVGITLAGDMTAMVRHRSMWVGSAGGHRLAGLLGGIVFLTVITGWLVYRGVQRIILPRARNRWRRAFVISLAAILILVFYPEDLRRSLPGELFTVIVGIVLLFLPMRVLGMVLVPYCATMPRNASASRWLSLRKYQWTLIALVGIFAGFGLALQELKGQRGWPHLTSHVALVILVYICLEAAGLLIGYGFLRKPLGLFADNTK